MDTRYPTTPLDQLVLRAVQALEGAGGRQAIADKVGELGKGNVGSRRIDEALQRLETRRYISSAPTDTLDTVESEPPAVPVACYHIEVFGERALTAPPMEGVISPRQLQKRVGLMVILVTFDNLNSLTWDVQSLKIPLRIAFGFAIVWVVIGIFQIRRAAYRISEWEAARKK